MAPPVNDNFASRAVLSGASGTINVNLVDSTMETGEPDPQDNETNSAWFEYVAPMDSQGVIFDTLGMSLSDSDTTLNLYTAEVDPPAFADLVLLKGNDDNDTDWAAFVPLIPEPGRKYYLQLQDWNGSNVDIPFNWRETVLTATDWFQPDDVLQNDNVQACKAVTASDHAGTGATDAGFGVVPAGVTAAGAVTMLWLDARGFVNRPVWPAGAAAEWVEFDGWTATGSQNRAGKNVRQDIGEADFFWALKGISTGGGKVLQVPTALMTTKLAAAPTAPWLTPTELATCTLLATVPSGTNTLTQPISAPEDDGGCWIVIVDDNHYAGTTPGTDATTDVENDPTAGYDHAFEARHLTRPPATRVLEEAAPSDPDLNLLESAGEASSATSVRVQALPVLPLTLGAALGAPRRLGAARMLGATPPVGVRIYQPRAAFDSEPWIVAGGRAERAPALGINAVTQAHATAYDSTEGVEDALSVTLGATRRWVADPDTFVDGLWEPSRGSTSVKFKGRTDGSQYIDPGYEYESRIGTLQRNAMVFAGGAWFTATAKMSGGDAWAIAMVMVVHANLDSTRATLLQSFQDDPDDPDNFQVATGLQDLCLDITGDKLMVRTGGRQTYDTLRTISDRPIIVVLSGTARRTRLLVVDRKYASHDFRHDDVGPTDMRFLLGRPNVEITRRRGTARMDLMDLATWNSDLGPKEMWRVASKLDSVYGVSR